VVPVRSNDARRNPKYFGRKKGATLVNMINDQGMGTAGLVVSGTPKDSLYAVDLIYRPDGGRRPAVSFPTPGRRSGPDPAAAARLRFEVRDEDVARLSPYMHARINVHGHYSFAPRNLEAAIGNRPLRDPAAED
jgi:hypothetical protein